MPLVTSTSDSAARARRDDESLARAYKDMRRMARRRVSTSGAHSIQATELVNETYLRLKERGFRWEDRSQLYFLASRAMRDILVERARRRQSSKRGGDWRRVSWESATEMSAAQPEGLLQLHAALLRLASQDAMHAKVVDLLYFGGFTIRETAQSLGLSTSTIDRRWRAARAWLHNELSSTD